MEQPKFSSRGLNSWPACGSSASVESALLYPVAFAAQRRCQSKNREWNAFPHCLGQTGFQSALKKDAALCRAPARKLDAMTNIISCSTDMSAAEKLCGTKNEYELLKSTYLLWQVGQQSLASSLGARR